MFLVCTIPASPLYGHKLKSITGGSGSPVAGDCLAALRLICWKPARRTAFNFTHDSVAV